jgi:hypothetical protein
VTLLEMSFRALAVAVLVASYVWNPVVGVAGLSVVFGYVCAQRSWILKGNQ